MTDSRIYLSSPDVGALEEEYVVNAIRSGWIAPLGPDVDLLENELAQRTGTQFAVALASGTAALHLVLESWGVGAGDVVVTSTMTFAATANAICYTGAEPYFVDCDNAGNMDPDLLEVALAELKKNGKRVPVVIPVDLLGKVADLDRINEVSLRFGARVLSDSAESVGATYRGRQAGSLAEASVFSFNGNKIMTTSGGGMVMTDDAQLAARVRHLASQAREPVVHYEHREVGYNYRLSNILAALGRAQLERLGEMMMRRREIRETYRRLFADIAGVELFDGGDDSNDNCWLTSVIVDPQVAGWSHGELSAHLSTHNIESRPIWKPMHLQPVFSHCGSTLNGTAQSLFDRVLTLPSGSALDDVAMERTRGAILEFLSMGR